MQTIDINELKLIKENFSEGNFSHIHIVSYDKKTYCFKAFKSRYPSQIIDKLGNYTEINFENCFLFPKEMVIKKRKIIGYLTDYNNLNQDITEMALSFDEKIKLLKDAKNKIELLHSNHNIIHGDLNLYNILSDKNFNTSLIDFDSSLYYGEIIEKSISLPDILIKYLKYYKYDYRADIFFYNINTLKFLYGIYRNQVLFESIRNDNLTSDIKIKTLSKQLLLEPESIKKENLTEYIIDYF